MRKRELLAGCSLLMLTMLSSCGTHYQLANVERSRILIDRRYDVQPDERAAAFLAPYKVVVDSVMEPEVGTVAKYMAAQRPESELSNLLADILVWGGKDYGEKPVVGVYNIGGIRAAFAEGRVTLGNVIDVAPFDNKICFLTLTGVQLKELFTQIASCGGEGVSHGVELEITADGRLLSARLNGQEIADNETYRIATLDYLAQGNDKLVAFRKGTNLNSPQTVENNVRFIIMNYFRDQKGMGKAVDAQKEGRIVIKE